MDLLRALLGITFFCGDFVVFSNDFTRAGHTLSTAIRRGVLSGSTVALSRLGRAHAPTAASGSAERAVRPRVAAALSFPGGL